MAEFSVMNSQGFPYGINLSRPPESIADTELVQAENCEYDEEDGSLKTVCGVTIKIDIWHLRRLEKDNKFRFEL